jgi:hypothetical protein
MHQAPGLVVELDKSGEELDIELAVMPPMFFAAWHLVGFGLFAHNSVDLMTRLQAYAFRESISLRLCHFSILFNCSLSGKKIEICFSQYGDDFGIV